MLLRAQVNSSFFIPRRFIQKFPWNESYFTKSFTNFWAMNGPNPWQIIKKIQDGIRRLKAFQGLENLLKRMAAIRQKKTSQSIEYFIFDPLKLKQISSAQYAWIQKRLASRLKLKRGCDDDKKLKH